MTDDHAMPERPDGGRFIIPFSNVETNDYLRSPVMINALKFSAIEYASQAEKRALREERLREILESQKLAATAEQGRQNTKIEVLTRDVQAANDRVRELRRQATAAFILSSLAAIIIAVGVNILTGDVNQAVGLVITGIGLATQIATYFVVQRRP